MAQPLLSKSWNFLNMLKRRALLLSGSTSLAFALTGCGGGGGDGETALADSDELDAGRKKPRYTEPDPTPTPTPTPTPAPAPARLPPPLRLRLLPCSAPAPVNGIAYPFGARLVPYSYGTRPSQSNSTMDAALKKQYDAWKAYAIKPADSIVAGG